MVGIQYFLLLLSNAPKINESVTLNLPSKPYIALSGIRYNLLSGIIWYLVKFDIWYPQCIFRGAIGPWPPLAKKNFFDIVKT